MVRFLGGMFSGGNGGGGVPRRTTKRRLQESARTPQLMREQHALYEYAMKEYAQTVRAGTSNDDGASQPQPIGGPSPPQAAAGAYQAPTMMMGPPPAPSAVPSSRRTTPLHHRNNHNTTSTPNNNHETANTNNALPSNNNINQHFRRSQSGVSETTSVHLATSTSLTTTSAASSCTSHDDDDESCSITSGSAFGRIPQPISSSAEPAFGLYPLQQHSGIQHRAQYSSHNNLNNNTNHNLLHLHPSPSTELERMSSTATSSPRYYVPSLFEQGVVSGIVYEEWYGDAYTGAPMKYVYPKGYQSMRPRSGPWRLSILICLCFTWLSVFVVGHCSDRVLDAELYNAMNNIDDDTLLIDIRWCGSRPLYLMWLASMLITGLSAAYCGVIGYIKCRDFAVANARAQPAPVAQAPPGCQDDPFATAAVDYDLAKQDAKRRRRRQGANGGGGGVVPVPGGGTATDYYHSAASDYYLSLDDDYYSHYQQYYAYANTNAQQQQQPPQRSIYQSDGTPQFWGSQIYRPTQAAVAVTSR